jgi:hypothetical protein
MTPTSERTYCTLPHTYGPSTAAAWREWAAEMARTHDNERCPDCGLWVIWRPRTQAEPEPVQMGLLDEDPS